MLNPFGVISENTIAHLTLFNSVQLGPVPLITLAPKYCSPNRAIDDLGFIWLVLDIIRTPLLGCANFPVFSNNVL